MANYQSIHTGNTIDNAVSTYLSKTEANNLYPTKAGGGATGTWAINISGNANCDGNGNTITSYYCTLETNQTLTGTKTFNTQTFFPQGLRTGQQAIDSTGKGVVINSDGGIEIYHASTPFIDFHQAASTNDYTTRIIEDASGELHMNSKLKVQTTRNNYALNCASFICDSWIRSCGSTGWYNESYGGGWYMTDSTWIRSYNNKSVYVDTGTLRCDGNIWGNKVQLADNWIGFYSNVASGTRYGYIQTNANRMYFRKENGVSSYHFDFNGHIYTSGQIQATNLGRSWIDGQRYLSSLRFQDASTGGSYLPWINQTVGGRWYSLGVLQSSSSGGSVWYLISSVTSRTANGMDTSFQYQGNGGKCYCTGGFYTGSDINLKTNITDMNNNEASIILSNLNVINYQMKNEVKREEEIKREEVPEILKEQNKAKIHTGISAQQLIQILEDNNLGEKHYLAKFKADGDNPDEDYWTINYAELTPILIKGWQIQQEKIESLEKEINELKQQLAALR